MHFCVSSRTNDLFSFQVDGSDHRRWKGKAIHGQGSVASLGYDGRILRWFLGRLLQRDSEDRMLVNVCVRGREYVHK